MPFQIPCTLSGDSNLAKVYIKGTWEWVQEKRVDRRLQDFIYLTPKTEGYTRKIIIDDSLVRSFKNGNIESTYKYKILLEKDITNFPEDSLTVFAQYRISDGIRDGYVPIKICQNYLLLQLQYVTSILGEETWKKL